MLVLRKDPPKMSTSVVDYFAVLGRGNGPLQCEPFTDLLSDEKSSVTASQVLDEAITDIAVLTADQSVPDDTWDLLIVSAEENQVEPPFLAVRRFIDSKRLDYITDIKLVLPNEHIPDGYELVSGAHTGSDAPSLLGRGFLIVKRANATDLRFWKSDPIVDDITFIKKSAGEELPEKYLEIEVLPGAQQQHHLHGRSAADVSIAFHRRPGLGLCDLVYQSTTTDRYPRMDHDKLELAVTGLPMFAFPNGMHLSLTDAGQFPLPLFFTFVFTDADGKHFYVACLQFYEQVAEADLQATFREVHGPDTEIKIPEDKRIFCPKVICTVSQWPFYRAMRRFLRQLYSLSFSTLRCPLEYYIASLVHQVPFPLEGGRPFHVTLDVALISHTSKAMAPIEFHLPSPTSFPLMDMDFAGPLRCLSVDHLLAVFALMLRESKLLFTCESNTMLTEVMETLRALLFPLTWSSCFVPRLPVALTGLLQAPGGFMIGMHVPSEAGSGTPALLRDLHSCRSLVPGTYVVDLTANSIAQYSGRAFDRLDTPRVDALLKLLPFGPKFRLHHALKKIASEFSIGPQAINLGEFDSAFEQQSAEGLINAEKWETFPTLQVRDAFFAFLIDFLGDYSRYIIPPSEDLAADTYRTFQEEFAIAQYLDLADKASRSTMELLLETQMFSALIQRRAEGRQLALVFFERAGSLVRELGLSAGGHGWNLPSRPAGEILELPLPVYGLVMADVQWAGLGHARQQLLRASTSAHSADTLALSSGTPLLSGRHHLHYLSTGTMNVLRSGTIPMPYHTAHPVLNQRLDDLLTMWEVLSFTPIAREKSGHLDTDVSDVQRAREEINLSIAELHLDNPAFGPLIVPGPARAYCGEDLQQQDGTVKTFSYHTGWPALSDEYTQQALEKAINPAVPAIRAMRMTYELQAGHDVLLLVRPQGRRWAFEQHGRLINPVHHLTVSEEVAAAVSLVADIAAMTLTLLSVRCMHRSKPTSDVLQMLGVLAQLDDWELLPSLPESVWRAVLLGCANAGGDLMRRICCIVYQLVPHATGQVADSLTYGCYLRALAAKKRHLGTLEPVNLGKANKSAPTLFSEPDPTDALLDAYLYLEEMGCTWYIQRSAMQGQTLSPPAVGNHNASSSNNIAGSRNHPVSPLSSVTGAMSKTLALGKRFPVPLSFRSADNSPGDLAQAGGDKRPMSIRPEATKLTSGQFSLADGPGMLVFHRPITQLSLCPPRKVCEFSSSAPETETAATTVRPSSVQPAALSAEVISRMDQLYAGALPHIRRAIVSVPPLRVPSAATARHPSRDRNDSVGSTATYSTANNNVSGDTSPVNPSSSSNRIAALSRRFFVTKKSEPSSPMPASSAEHHIELTDTHSNSNQRNTRAPSGSNSPAAPSSPNPFGWAKKLRPAMFFGSSPATSAAGVAAGSTTPKVHAPAADIELKVLSATLNFDDEDSGGDDDAEGDGEEDGDSAVSEGASASGSEGDGAPAWASLPSPARDSPVPVEGLVAASEVVETQPPAEVTMLLPDLESTEEPEPLIALDLLETTQTTHTGDTASTTANLLDLDCEAVAVVVDEDLLFRTGENTAQHSPLPPSESEAEGDTPIAASQAEEVTVAAEAEAEMVTAKPKPVDVVTLQAQLLQAFEEEFVAEGRVLGIHSATPCPHCGFTMLDEEVLSRWCHGHGYEAHIKGNNKSPLARDMSAVHQITCKQCAEAFAPQLHVSCFTRASSTASPTTSPTPSSSAEKVDELESVEVAEETSEGDTPPSTARRSLHALVPLTCLWTEHVGYLSPFGLRYEMESLLLQHGHAAFTTAWLHAHHPVLLWGILFYSARAHLPSGLHHLSAPSNGVAAAALAGGRTAPHDISFLHPVVVGWRECTVRALASRVLTGKAYDFLAVRDVFPGCTEEDAARLEDEVVPALDGSPAGMRLAMLAFSQCPSVMAYGQQEGFSVARLVNIGLLMICYLYHKTEFTVPKLFSQLAHLEKDVHFEKTFVDAIKCVLSQVDLLAIGASEPELLAACASKSVVVVRNTLGFLY